MGIAVQRGESVDPVNGRLDAVECADLAALSGRGPEPARVALGVAPGRAGEKRPEPGALKTIPSTSAHLG